MKFKRGDLVKIKSKSTGRRLSDVKKESYDITKPQKIERIDGRIILIKGDYYWESDVEPVYGVKDLSDLFNNLIEEL